MNCNLECFVENFNKLSDFVFFHASFLTVYPIGFTCLFHLPVQFSSVTQSCLTLCDPMDCSMPGFPVHHELLDFTQTQVHWVGDAIQPSHPCCLLLLPPQSFLASGVFPVSQFFTSGGQNTGASVSASDLPMNIQDWFPSGLTRLISLQSKGLSRVFSNTKSINSVVLSFLCGLTLTSIHDYWKNHNFD